jgi:histone-lysine N-methyltransferase SETD1
MAARTAQTQKVVADFGLPENILNWETAAAPSSKAQIRSKRLGPKQSTRVLPSKKKCKNENFVDLKKSLTDSKTYIRKEKEKWSKSALETEKGYSEEDSKEFKATCARLLPNKAVKSVEKASCQTQSREKQDRPRNLRQYQVTISAAVDSDGRMDRRAERAKQRRLLKGMAAFSNFDLDTLSSREPQLRFDRSGIHAWGVFADKDISSGDMIVEYRGEIIENAMAEKREKLYEAAKIGSDYMFRIDGRFVCDATKVGNVARFLNASCDPNCYTKIITVDGQKRIVIYAKKDIRAGEELCYDYKFVSCYDIIDMEKRSWKMIGLS